MKNTIILIIFSLGVISPIYANTLLSEAISLAKEEIAYAKRMSFQNKHSGAMLEGDAYLANEVFEHNNKTCIILTTEKDPSNENATWISVFLSETNDEDINLLKRGAFVRFRGEFSFFSGPQIILNNGVIDLEGK